MKARSWIAMLFHSPVLLSSLKVTDVTQNRLGFEAIGQSVCEPQRQGRVSEMEGGLAGVVGKDPEKEASVNGLSEPWGHLFLWGKACGASFLSIPLAIKILWNEMLDFLLLYFFF